MAFLLQELDLSSCMTWIAEEMRLTLMIALAVYLLTETVVIIKMQERFVHKVYW